MTPEPTPTDETPETTQAVSENLNPEPSATEPESTQPADTATAAA